MLCARTTWPLEAHCSSMLPQQRPNSRIEIKSKAVQVALRVEVVDVRNAVGMVAWRSGAKTQTRVRESHFDVCLPGKMQIMSSSTWLSYRRLWPTKNKSNWSNYRQTLTSYSMTARAKEFHSSNGTNGLASISRPHWPISLSIRDKGWIISRRRVSPSFSSAWRS